MVRSQPPKYYVLCFHAQGVVEMTHLEMQIDKLLLIVSPTGEDGMLVLK